MDQAQKGTDGNAHTSPQMYDGATFDFERGNVDFEVLPSAVRSATLSSADFTNHNGRGIILFLNITAVPTIDTVLLRMEIRDPVSGLYKLMFAGTAQSATGLTTYYVYPGGADAGQYTNRISSPLPRTFKLMVVHSAATNFTYSVGASLLR